METAPVMIDGQQLFPRSQQIYHWVMQKLKSNDPLLYLFVHGTAGSGKSLLLKAIRNGAMEIFGNEGSCVVTAPTAMGAELIDANTINHIFITWNKISLADFLESANDGQMNHFSWMQNAKLILIDIINFVDSICFATIDHRLRQITGIKKPFGGLSVIVFGDFYQLPPVNETWIFKGLPDDYLEKFQRKCPESPANLWSLMKIVELTDNRRSDGDDSVILEVMRTDPNENFYDFLNAHCSLCMDRDQSKEEIVNKFISMSEDRPDLTFAVLATTRDIVNDINNAIVDRYEFPCSFPPRESFRRYQKRGHKSDMYLKIHVGCPVVLTCNVGNFKNGARGVVDGFTDEIITVRFTTGVQNLRREDWYSNGNEWSQFPIRVAYANTIEQSQGMTFEAIILVRNISWDREEFRSWMECHEDDTGNLYTALSRARNLTDCFVTPLRNPQFVVSAKAREEIERMRSHCIA